MLPPEGAVLQVVAPEVGTVADARLEAVFATATLSKGGASPALAELEQTHASLRTTHADRKRSKHFERDL